MVVVWMTGWPGVGWPARGWTQRFAPSAEVAAGVPEPGELLASMARHPSFTAERAARVLVGRSWSVLRQTWVASAHALDVVECPEAGHGLVLLRAAVLDEMQRSHPQAFAAWYAREWDRCAAQPSPRRRGPSTVD